jgi:predicted CXXCH cytochrome family protein
LAIVASTGSGEGCTVDSTVTHTQVWLWRALLLTATTAALLLVVGVGLASAQNGPIPPQPGDPVGTNVSPHGGYSSSSNFCTQCHSMHDAGEYALMWQSNVTATCATCHSVGGGSTAPRSPAGTGNVGTASSRPVYEVTGEDRESGHGIGANAAPGEDVVMTESGWTSSWRNRRTPAATDSNVPAGPGTASTDDGGLYCASCHTPHGNFGYPVNKWDPAVDERKVVQINAANRFLDWDGASRAWRLCTTEAAVTLGDASNASCGWATIVDEAGQTVSLESYKMLSAYPNHTYSTQQSWGVVGRNTDGGKWCATCHETRIDESFGTGSTFHNHPTRCTSCHGNPLDGSSKDFPHTSTMEALLKDYPDALCVSCHGAGGMP